MSIPNELSAQFFTVAGRKKKQVYEMLCMRA